MHPVKLMLGISVSTFFLLRSQISVAENVAVPLPSNAPLELNFLVNPEGLVTTANTIYQEKINIPSLWWAKENSQYKLLDNWIAYPATHKNPGRLDLIVNEQIWTLLDYIERYQFVNRLGIVARDYKYNMRVFNYQKELLATYTCNFKTIKPLCKIKMDNQALAELL